MRTRRLHLLIALLCAVPAGCREDAMAVEANDVRVEAAEDHLVVTNGRHERIWYFAQFELGGNVIIDWAPCTSAHCPSVAAQTIMRVPYREVTGDGGSTILFYWWTAGVENSPTLDQVHLLRVER